MTPPSWAVESLIEQLAAVANRAEQRATKERFMAEYRVSPSTLSRLLISSGIRSHSRNDKGIARKAVTAGAIESMLAIQAASRSLRKGDIAPARRVVEIAELNGIVQPGEIAPDYFNRYIRERGLSRQQRKRPELHVQLASIGPNHVHQVDFSLATNWVFARNGIRFDRWAEDPTKLASPRAGEMRLWRMLVVDHATGMFFPYYGAQSGETVAMLLQGLFYAWSEKKISGESILRKYPFRGVPRILMFDRGPATKSQIAKNVLARLGVQMIEAQAARAKGTVERSMGIFEEDFESGLRLQKPETIDQLNWWAWDAAAGYCAKLIHRRTGMTRTDAWTRLINREEETRLRDLRCDLETFLSIALSNPESRVVRGNAAFEYKGRHYRVPSELMYEQKVFVQFSPFEFPDVQVRASEDPASPAWVCRPIEKNHLGFEVDAPVIGKTFKSHKQHAAAKQLGREGTIVQVANGLAEAQSLQVFGHRLDGTNDVQLSPRGAELNVTSAAPYRTRTQAREEISNALGNPAFTAPERALLASLPEQVSEQQIDELIETLRQGVSGKMLAFAAG